MAAISSVSIGEPTKASLINKIIEAVNAIYDVDDDNFETLAAPTGTILIFGNAKAGLPSGWTHLTTWQDKSNLVFTTSTGAMSEAGTADADANHDHAVGTYAFPNHTHAGKFGGASSGYAGGTDYVYWNDAVNQELIACPTGGLTDRNYIKTGTATDAGAAITGTSGGKSSKYRTVIAATKD